MTLYFLLLSPIKQMQSPIYLENYLELRTTAFLAPCCFFMVCPVTKTTNSNKHALTTAAPNIWCSEQASLQMAGLVVLCDFMLAAGSSQIHRRTLTVTDFTQSWNCARIQIVLLAWQKEQ